MPPRAAQYPEQQAHSRIPMSVPDWRQPQGLRGRSGFKPTCRAEFAAWTASGRAGLGAGGPRQGLAGLRDDAPSERSATKRRRCGGHRGACGAWPRCRWAAAGPGLDPRRRTEPHVSDHAPLVWRAPVGGGRDRADYPTALSTARLEAAAGPAGPGLGAGGRRQGLAGLRDRSLRAAGSRVAISRAGRRPPAHTAAKPNKTGHAAPGKPVVPQAPPESQNSS